MVARLTREPALKIGIPEVRLKGEDPGRPPVGAFAVGRDGRLLMLQPVGDAAARARLVLVQNWPAAIAAR